MNELQPATAKTHRYLSSSRGHYLPSPEISFPGRLPILVAGILLLTLAFTHPATAAAQIDPVTDVFNRVNAVRAEVGLPPYQANAALAAAAQAHSEWGASVGYFDHTEPDGSHAQDRAIRAGYGAPGTVRVSENIYWGTLATPESAVTWWRNSPIHYAGMTSPNYQELGVGVAYGDSGGYFTLNFGIKLDVPPPASNPGSAAPDESAQQQAFAAAEDVEIPTVATFAPNADGSIVHTVQDGQALWNIAAAYKVDVLDLLAQNGLTDGDFVYPGDQIVIRSASTPTPTLPPPTATRRPTLTPIAVAQRPDSPESVSASTGVIGAISESQAAIQRILFATLLFGIALILLGTLGVSRASRRHRPD